jgi:hypothetical protein
MGKAASTLVALVAAVIWYVGWGGDPKTSSCVRQVKQVESAYRSSRPKAESHRVNLRAAGASPTDVVRWLQEEIRRRGR